MNAEQWNARYPVGTLVFAYPGVRPEDGAGIRLVTRTRTEAQLSASGDPVVWVEGEGAYISLTHVNPVAEDVWEEARKTETAAQTPEPTSSPKTAREKVAGLLWWSVPSGTDEEAKARTNQLLDELTAEVRTERDTQFVAWLLKRSREDEHGDVIARLASKVQRGAVRPNNLRTDFFQPGHGYTHLDGHDFLCVAVINHPVTGEQLAMGWRSEHDEWHRPTVVGINQWRHEYDGVEPPKDGA
ncbi:hypothetical protein ADL07_11910 [Streptomyces sp. NRRL F-4707]|uniref:hypothetical protein n=1 Tax=Streptomyces sp. NRRL F-4707 TaxID=1519496 RepID=UPI0006B0284C|nr:hypothetical protein [Streptomyces sp. NRRL F-4707]KOX32850.1 hypothetical protein ADL07_11910 [Streptomyces sp. NRRL F-4707]